VTARGRAPLSRRLHLNTQKAVIDLADEIDIGTVPKGDPDERALACQPLHGRELAEVALDPAVDRSLAAMRAGGGRGLWHERMFANV
jgi:hypothetical protein